MLWLPFLGSLSQPRKTVSLSCTLDRREGEREEERGSEVERGDKDRKAETRRKKEERSGGGGGGRGAVHTGQLHI